MKKRVLRILGQDFIEILKFKVKQFTRIFRSIHRRYLTLVVRVRWVFVFIIGLHGRNQRDDEN